MLHFCIHYLGYRIAHVEGEKGCTTRLGQHELSLNCLNPEQNLVFFFVIDLRRIPFEMKRVVVFLGFCLSIRVRGCFRR